MFGLLGERLGHSYSKIIHDLLSEGDYQYGLMEVSPADLPSFFEKSAFQGLNVTLPYKRAVIPYMKTLTKKAEKIGCVNTIYQGTQGWIGENTDYDGFRYMIKKAGVSLKGKKVLLMGDGGTSLTAKTVIQDEGASELVQVSRRGSLTFDSLLSDQRHRDAQIIVNTTPVGMYPKNGSTLVNLSDYPSCEGVVDVIYNPLRTALLLQAEKLGIPHTDGLTMLVAQAKFASDLFLNRVTSDERIDQVVKIIKQRILNLILVGMPGSGKTTIGASLAQRLNRQFVDLDTEIEKFSGKTIPQIFAESGEDSFRDLEEQVTAQFGKENGLVIAGGGGVVLREKNRLNFHQNGLVIWLTRPAERLPVEGRPLSKSFENLKQMEEIRAPYYQAAADFQVNNHGTVDETVDQILAWVQRGVGLN